MPNPPSPPINPATAPDLIVRGKRVIAPEGERPAAIHVRGGTITVVTEFGEVPSGCPIHEAGESIVMPGLVDTHVHINEPGRVEWEGFSTATHAAAAGGVTTLIDMPLNSIPATTTAAALREKIAAAAGKLWADTGFWGGVVPGNASELRALWDGGVFGFKCFLVPSGVDEFQRVTDAELRAALPELVALGAPLLVHAESPEALDRAVAKAAKMSPRKYATWLAARPREAENEAIDFLLGLCREFKLHIHVVHLSSADPAPQLRQAKAEAMPFSSETCPHYLTFASEDVPDGATEYKCAPPIREGENRAKLWTVLGDGTIDMIASDHSPCPPAMKLSEEGDFLRAWGGIASLQLSLPATWTEARSRGYDARRIAGWMCGGPARLAGIDKRKGAIAPGLDADLVIWNPDAKFRVDPAQLFHRHRITPYGGRELAGVVETTFLRGRIVFQHGEFPTGPIGQVLRRGAA
ncbi:MAG: allantoinase AllB [Candidatus Acidiferrales bacterium]